MVSRKGTQPKWLHLAKPSPWLPLQPAPQPPFFAPPAKWLHLAKPSPAKWLPLQPAPQPSASQSHLGAPHLWPPHEQPLRPPRIFFSPPQRLLWRRPLPLPESPPSVSHLFPTHPLLRLVQLPPSLVQII